VHRDGYLEYATKYLGRRRSLGEGSFTVSGRDTYSVFEIVEYPRGVVFPEPSASGEYIHRLREKQQAS
jgi:hypothetical protein